MNSMALASVFTPGILLNPDDAMNPNHYKLSQKVVQFLIEHQQHFHLPNNNNNNQLRKPSFQVLSHQKTIMSNNESTIDSNSSSIIRQHLLRANTVPAKQNRFGPNDPLQIVK